MPPRPPETRLRIAVAALLRPGTGSGPSGPGTEVLIALRRPDAIRGGVWELPGGKVAPGETEAEALTRELREELGLEVVVGERIGADVQAGESVLLRAYRVTRTGGVLLAHDHGELRWVDIVDLGELPWVPADRAWLPALRALLQG